MLNSILNNSDSQKFLRKIDDLVRNKLQQQNFNELLNIDESEFGKFENEIVQLQLQIEQLQNKLKNQKSNLRMKFKNELENIYEQFIEMLDENDNKTLHQPSSKKYIIKVIKDVILEQ